MIEFPHSLGVCSTVYLCSPSSPPPLHALPEGGLALPFPLSVSLSSLRVIIMITYGAARAAALALQSAEWTDVEWIRSANRAEDARPSVSPH